MKSLPVFVTVILFFLLSCVNQNNTVKQQPKEDRIQAIDIVNKFNHYYNEENYSELKKLYSDTLLTADRVNPVEQLWAERFEFGVLKKSKLLQYNVIAKGQEDTPEKYDLLVENKYANCTMKVHFIMKKDLKGEIRLVDHRLILN